MKNMLPFLLCLPFFCHSQIPDSLALVHRIDSLVNLSENLRKAKNFKEALPVAELAWQLSQQGLDSLHPSRAFSLHSLGTICLGMEQPRKAVSFLEEALRIRGKDEEDAEYLKTLNNLSLAYADLGQFPQAEALLLKSLHIREKVYGEESLPFATALQSIANFYRNLGRYAAAEPLLNKCKDIRLKLLGCYSRDYANAVNSLAAIYLEMERYEEAEPLLRVAIGIIDSLEGKSDPGMLMNLATANLHLGRFEEAEQFNLEALEAFEIQQKKETSWYAVNLSNYGLLHQQLGNFDEAEKRYRQALGILQKMDTPPPASLALVLANLGAILILKNQYEEAEEFLMEAKNLQAKRLGLEHKDYANSLSNLGYLYQNMKKWSQAEQYHLESIAIGEKNGFDYSGALSNLGVLRHQAGKLQEARLCFDQALKIREKIFGKEHLNYARAERWLLGFHAEMKEWEQVARLAPDCSKRFVGHTLRTSKYLSDRGIDAYLKFYFPFDLFNACAWEHSDTALEKICYDHALFYKGFLLESSLKLRRILEQTGDTPPAYLQWKSLHLNLAIQYAKPLDEQTQVTEMEAQANELEKQLAKTIAGFDDARRLATWQDVQAQLGKDEAAIEFVEFIVRNKFGETTGVRYAALVLRPSGGEPPHFVRLLEKEKLASLLSLAENATPDFISNLYQSGSLGDSLFDWVWKPVAPFLDGVKTVYFSPDGLLHRLSFSAIPVGNSTLGDQFQMIRLVSTRQLAFPSASNAASPQKTAVVFGGINYDLASTSLVKSKSNRKELETKGLRRSLRNFDPEGDEWKYLTGSEQESKTVSHQFRADGWQVKVFEGAEASEDVFKQLGEQPPSPSALHIATHGYFFPEPKTDSKHLDSEGMISTENQAGIAFRVNDHPMIRSGLVLAGANHAWKGKPLPPEAEDGILTAYEISQMNLSNTELVVLSACETGLGDIVNNEGVHGLQRAFKIAGAKYLVMSLWKVPDYASMELMSEFYNYLLKEKMSVPAAFRAAQQAMRTKYDPFFWAGFVLME
ncbi:MAG: CHAT domain-containing tetratricopeptide repeat protein [Bacteroidota bacterium]